MSAPQICGKARNDILADIGTALLQIKNARVLSLPDMADKIGKSDDQLARYIAGDMEMGVVAWLRALETWPELAELIEETERDRVLKSRQRPLDLNQPIRREKAA